MKQVFHLNGTSRNALQSLMYQLIIIQILEPAISTFLGIDLYKNGPRSVYLTCTGEHVATIK